MPLREYWLLLAPTARPAAPGQRRGDAADWCQTGI